MHKDLNTVETMGLAAAMSPFLQGDSAVRVQMTSSHRAQALQFKESNLPRTLTCLERQLGEYTFNITMPVNGIIISKHKRYIKGRSEGSIGGTPYITLIYQNQETGEYDLIDIRDTHSRHRVYGTDLIINPIVNTLVPGQGIAKGTILASNPSVKATGEYAAGLETNVVYMSTPCINEDGYGISESYRRRASPLEMLSYVCSFGKKSYALNTYGDKNNFKPFPDIGDTIRPDGLIFATRTYDEDFDAVDMTPKGLLDIDLMFDDLIYGTPNAEVYDITVESGIGESRPKTVTPKGLCGQLDKYIHATNMYYDGILNSYKKLCKENRSVSLSPELHRLTVRALADKPNENDKSKSNSTGGKIRRNYKKVPLDEFRVEVKTRKRKLIDLGAKFTGQHGNKGVICRIFPDADMPVDKDGNVADMIGFSKAVVARTNTGQKTEHYVAAASRDLSKRVRRMFDSNGDYEECWDELMRYFGVTSLSQLEQMTTNYTTPTLRRGYVMNVIKDGIYLYSDVTNPLMNKDVVERIKTVISPTIGPVTYRDTTGRMVTTKDDVMVGILDMIILEKTDIHPMASSSGTLQHHGLLSSSNKASRLAHPSKNQTVRAFGETEERLYIATMGGEFVANMLDMSNNPVTHREGIKTIMRAKNPALIKQLVNRRKFPRGNSRVLSYIKHIFLCMGIKMKN